MSSKLLNYPTAGSNPHHLGVGGSSGAGGSAGGSVTGSGSSSRSGQLNFENLQLDDILCTVCQSVLVEPVFLPCQHRFCRNCLSGTIEKNNLNCPCCRKRFGTWYRNASRVNKLVHQQLWSAIQSQFRDYLEDDGGGGADGSGTGTNRCNGNGSAGSCFVPHAEIHLSEPGEIRKEYENELQRYRKELIEDKKKELAASEKYIINLYKQEGIIDLVDSSDHLSISSTTSTPDQQQNPKPTAEQIKKTVTFTNKASVVQVEDDDDDQAGPSGSSYPKPSNSSDPKSDNSSSSNKVNTSPPGTSKSPSNGSVISISSTSSASAASSSCISSVSSQYSVSKGQQSSKHSAGSKVQQQPKRVFTMAELNKSEVCIKPTKLHKRIPSQKGTTTTKQSGNDNEEDDDEDDDDGDSLRSELNHFKPILATTPKSCFSPKSVVRVPSVRPETANRPSTGVSAKLDSFSPSKSPFKPINPTTPRRSAFSIVNINLFTPPTVSQFAKGTEATPKSRNSGNRKSSSSRKKSSPSKKQNQKPRTTAIQRKKKLKFSSPASKPNVKEELPIVSVQKPVALGSRVTRRSLNTRQEAQQLKNLIISDQERRQAMIEQERKDFEFAQKLQKKLNRTRGSIVMSLPQSLIDPPVLKEITITNRRNTQAYSLRRKTVTIFGTTGIIQEESKLELPPPSETSSRSSSSRKRKTTSVSEVSTKAITKKSKVQTAVLEPGETGPRRSNRNRH
ncbi:E3 ubiquitin-protein ligase rnf168-like [Uranotaenia lowii]|uniref:E3 ubiquitin-protein ligase rnf168-like n=1 Tax=Uranotaenia lowii TaxID=190385 RepID=UPI0024798B47|nr:E3 ubiquitin-protein ligase rnf168-like [Uranotaenia lowii]